MSVKYYYSSISGDRKIKQQQQKIEQLLTSLKIDFERIDISSSEDAKKTMRALMNDPKALPPQLFNGDQYCGTFDQLDDAKEGGIKEINKFLLIDTSTGEQEEVSLGD